MANEEKKVEVVRSDVVRVLAQEMFNMGIEVGRGALKLEASLAQANEIVKQMKDKYESDKGE